MTDKIVITADSTQIDAFLACERLWKYAHDERLSAPGVKPGMPLLKGTYGHGIAEHYYKSLASGSSLSQALECGLAWKPPADFELSPAEFPAIQQRFREYSFTYSHNEFEPHSPEHVEVGFSEKIFENDDFLFILEGRIDLLGKYCGQDCIVDHKFQLRYHDLYKKAIQFRNYALVARSNLLIINMIRLTQKIDNKTFERIPVSFSPLEHQWWKGYLIQIFHRMAARKQEMINRGYTAPGVHNPNFIYEPNWSACSGKFGYECDYTKLCEPTEQEPALLQAKKDTLYVIRPEWKPW